MAPVRARIASSSVVLPLWNGPTSAMHRGPVALVPFCAMFRHPSALSCGLVSILGRSTIVSVSGEIGKRFIRMERPYRSAPMLGYRPAEGDQTSAPLTTSGRSCHFGEVTIRRSSGTLQPYDVPASRHQPTTGFQNLFGEPARR